MRRGAIDDQKRARQPPAAGDEAAEPLPEELLRLCDALRDEVLPSLGVRLEDRSKGAAAQLTLDDPDIVMAEARRTRTPTPTPTPTPTRTPTRTPTPSGIVMMVTRWGGGLTTHYALLLTPYSSLLTPH